jgi:hypothetical protein
MVCDDKTCLPPDQKAFSFELTTDAVSEKKNELSEPEYS